MEENLSKMDAAALQTKAAELKRALFDLRMEAGAMQVKDYSQFCKLRKDVARVLTELTARKKQARS